MTDSKKRVKYGYSSPVVCTVYMLYVSMQKKILMRASIKLHAGMVKFLIFEYSDSTTKTMGPQCYDNSPKTIPVKKQ